MIMQHLKIKLKNEMKPKEAHTFSICDARDKRAKEIERQIVHFLHTLKTPQERWEPLRQCYDELHRLFMVDQVVVKNILPTAGRSVVAQWITGDATFDADAGANFGSLGTDNTAPADGDTQLGAETFRKATSSAATASNVAFLSNFYTATEVTGTFQEAAWHIDGTGTANTGEILSHFLTGSIVKSATETLTIESQITVS
jgi:hypothetical protein